MFDFEYGLLGSLGLQANLRQGLTLLEGSVRHIKEPLGVVKDLTEEGGSAERMGGKQIAYWCSLDNFG